MRYEKECVPSSREELGLELIDPLGAPLMLTSSETVGITAGHTDVSLWYVVTAERGVRINFDAEEFFGVQWFHYDDAPRSRSDPNLDRFLRKLALTTGLTRARAAP